MVDQSTIDALGNIMDENFKTLINQIVKLEQQVGINCNKLDKIKEDTDLLPAMYELIQANGEKIEIVSERIDKLES